MGDHEATGAKNRLVEYLLTRAKAVIYAVGVAVVGTVAALVANPDTATVIAGYLPEQLRFLVPAVLAAIGLVVLERTANKPMKPKANLAAAQAAAEDAELEQEATDVR